MHDVRTPAQTPARKTIGAWRGHNRQRWQFEKVVLSAGERVPFAYQRTSDEHVGPVELTMSEYEAAHVYPNWHTVLPDHVLPDDGGRVVLRDPRFWVVEMRALQGTAPC